MAARGMQAVHLPWASSLGGRQKERHELGANHPFHQQFNGTGGGNIIGPLPSSHLREGADSISQCSGDMVTFSGLLLNWHLSPPGALWRCFHRVPGAFAGRCCWVWTTHPQQRCLLLSRAFSQLKASRWPSETREEPGEHGTFPESHAGATVSMVRAVHWRDQGLLGKQEKKREAEVVRVTQAGQKQW